MRSIQKWSSINLQAFFYKNDSGILFHEIGYNTKVNFLRKRWGKYSWEEWKDDNKGDHQGFLGVT